MPFATSGPWRLYYELRGSGPAVVFLHGAGSNTATWWQQWPAFTQRHTCLAYDNRCFGRSRAPLEDFDPAGFVDDLARVMDAAGLERAALVGQSMGGMTALRFALRFPDRVSAFVACDSPLAVTHPQLLADMEHHARTAGAAKLENRALAPDFPQRHPELAQLYKAINQFNPHIYEGTTGRTWAQCLDAVRTPEFLLPVQAMSALRCPTLFVVGSLDPIVKPEVVHDIARHVPRSEVAVFEGAGHSTYFEQAPGFNATVLDFLSRHLASEASPVLASQT